MSTYKIDLEAAKNSEHSEYMFRLMFALNDLLSARQIISLTGRIKTARKDALVSYAIRLFIAHLVEACIAFIEKVRPSREGKPRHAVYDFIAKDPGSFALFKELDAQMRTADFSKLRDLRDYFIFHYNYEDNGSETAKALEALTYKFENCPSGLENRIDRTTNPITTRFYVADELVNVAWRMTVGVPECSEKSEAMETHQKCWGKAGLTFIKFAETLSLYWITEFNLQERK